MVLHRMLSAKQIRNGILNTLLLNRFAVIPIGLFLTITVAIGTRLFMTRTIVSLPFLYTGESLHQVATIGLLFGGAIGAGALNAVAGGGSFLSFPILLLMGIPAPLASATNTVAIWMGVLGSTGAYRRELNTNIYLLTVLGSASFIGSIIGAQTLVNIPPLFFKQAVPYLLLAATLLFTFDTRIIAWSRARFTRKNSCLPVLPIVACLLFVIAVYGGVFAGGTAILILSVLSLLELQDMHAMNALKVQLLVLITGTATGTFMLMGAVIWSHALLMGLGAIIGGYAGAAWARRMTPIRIRQLALFIAFTMTIIVFITQHT